MPSAGGQGAPAQGAQHGMQRLQLALVQLQPPKRQACHTLVPTAWVVRVTVGMQQQELHHRLPCSMGQRRAVHRAMLAGMEAGRGRGMGTATICC